MKFSERNLLQWHQYFWFCTVLALLRFSELCVRVCTGLSWWYLHFLWDNLVWHKVYNKTSAVGWPEPCGNVRFWLLLQMSTCIFCLKGGKVSAFYMDITHQKNIPEILLQCAVFTLKANACSLWQSTFLDWITRCAFYKRGSPGNSWTSGNPILSHWSSACACRWSGNMNRFTDRSVASCSRQEKGEETVEMQWQIQWKVLFWL